MKKLLILIITSLLLIGCSDPNNNDTTPPIEDVKDNFPGEIPVEDLINEFSDRLIVDTDDDYRVKDFKSKEELINNLSEIMNKEVAKDYVDIFYREDTDGVYLVPTEGPLLLNFDLPYELNKKDDTTYYAVQENETVLHGKYKLTILFKYSNEKWIIEDIKVDVENIGEEESEVQEPDEQEPEDNVNNDTEDILILVNKEKSISSQYVPKNLTEPDVLFSFEEDLPKRKIRTKAAIALEEMFNSAKKDKINLYATSGYRSYNRQKIIFDYRANQRGEEVANQTTARPGESEHQTGLAMDITSRSANFGLTQYFGETKEGKWVKENSWNFGFIIRYPKGKEHITGYTYEPWHLRYVGVDAAKYIYENNITLEEYLELN